MVIFHNQNQLKTGRLSLDRKTRTEHVYMYICKYHHVPSNIIHHVHLYICKYYHTIISSYFSFIIPVAPVYNYANFTPDSKVRFLGKLSAAMDQVALGLQARAFLKSVSNWSRNPFKYRRHTSDIPYSKNLKRWFNAGKANNLPMVCNGLRKVYKRWQNAGKANNLPMVYSV